MTDDDSKMSSNDVDFQVGSDPNEVTCPMNDEFIENYFGDSIGASSTPRQDMTSPKFWGPKAKRSSNVVMALSEEAEGNWGSVKRNYIIGGNWKSNGDWDFINSFPKDILNKSSFNSSKVEVMVAPTDLHLSAVR